MWMSAVEALRLLWSWVGCCWLPRSLRHAGSRRAGRHASSNAFSKLETTRARVSASLPAAHSACARAAAGPRQPARSGQRASISSRASPSRALYACLDCPRSPAPPQTHARARYVRSPPADPCTPRRHLCGGRRGPCQSTSRCSRTTTARCRSASGVTATVPGSRSGCWRRDGLPAWAWMRVSTSLKIGVNTGVECCEYRPRDP